MIHPLQTRFPAWHRHVRRELVWVYEGEPPSRWISANPARSVAWRILEGEATVRSEDGYLEAHVGQWVCPGDKFDQYFTPGAQIISVHFYCEWAFGRSLLPQNLQLVFEGEKYPNLEAQARRFVTTLPANERTGPTALAGANIDLGSYMKIEGAFCDWLLAWLEAVTSEGVSLTEVPQVRPEILKVGDYIRSLISDGRPFDEIEAAQFAGLSRSSLRTAYQDIVGMTPHEHYLHYKLEAARTSLELRDIPIKTIAYDLGFQSLSQFSNWFRRRMGVSPTEYRADHCPSVNAEGSALRA